MKFGKWLRHVAAAAVAGCMMLSVSMPALAATWDITGKNGEPLRIYRNADDGKQYVGWGWEASDDVQDENPVITGKSVRYVNIQLDGTNGTVRATMQDMENVACSHVQVVDVMGDAELTLEGTNTITKSIGTKIGKAAYYYVGDASSPYKPYEGEANLTINGTGSLQLGEAGLAYDSYYKPNCAAINGLDSLTLESGAVKAYGSVNTEKITVNGSAKLAIQKADADQPYWLFNKAGEELAFGGQNKNYGSVSYYNADGTLDHEASVEQPDTGDVTDTASADGGGAAVGVALGAAAVWGGYEVATRVILNNLLPEGAAIPKTQAELAVLLWNTAGRPEPANAPAFADVDDTTAKAAQWCTEQGCLTGNFKPAKRVTKFNVIRTWNRAFPKN